MKEYMLYVTNASNHNSLITKDAKGQPFTKETAIEYGKQILDILPQLKQWDSWMLAWLRG